MFKGILLSASLSGYQFLQVSDCVVLVAFYPHLGITLFRFAFFVSNSGELRKGFFVYLRLLFIHLLSQPVIAGDLDHVGAKKSL